MTSSTKPGPDTAGTSELTPVLVIIPTYNEAENLERIVSRVHEHNPQADILVAAAGKANLITKDMVKSGASVVDVSTNWAGGRQVGDLGPGVDEVAGWLTPNPGGVGPMTRAMLIKNTFEAEVRRRP